MRYVDAHVHLSDPEYEKYVDNLIEDAGRSNVVAMVSNSTNLQTSLRSIELAERYPKSVYAALGIHPWNVKGLLQNELEQTTDLITSHGRNRGVVAIGEIGLDYKYVNGGKRELMSKQYEIFCRMLRLGEELSLPAIIHSRGTTQEIMDILASYNIKKILLHWFSNPIELLPKIVERGYYISEGPATLFSSGIQEIVRQVPLNGLLTETDGPVRFFKPPFNGEMTTPAIISLIVDAMAKIKREEKVQIADQIYRNFVTFFGNG
jgi:TatD DNase family protein